MVLHTVTFATFSLPSVKPLLNFPYDDNEFITINNTILTKEAISCKQQPQVREGTIFTDDQTLSRTLSTLDHRSRYATYLAHIKPT